MLAPDNYSFSVSSRLISGVVCQESHLLNRDLAQLEKPVRLRLHSRMKRIQVLQIARGKPTRHVDVISDIAFPARMAVAPFLSSLRRGARRPSSP